MSRRPTVSSVHLATLRSRIGSDDEAVRAALEPGVLRRLALDDEEGIAQARLTVQMVISAASFPFGEDELAKHTIDELAHLDEALVRESDVSTELLWESLSIALRGDELPAAPAALVPHLERVRDGGVLWGELNGHEWSYYAWLPHEALPAFRAWLPTLAGRREFAGLTGDFDVVTAWLDGVHARGRDVWFFFS